MSALVFRPAVVVTHALGVHAVGRDIAVFLVVTLLLGDGLTTVVAHRGSETVDTTGLLLAWDVAKISAVLLVLALLALRLRAAGPALLGLGLSLVAVAAHSDWYTGLAEAVQRNFDVSPLQSVRSAPSQSWAAVLAVVATGAALWIAGFWLQRGLRLMTRPKWVLLAAGVLLAELFALEVLSSGSQNPFSTVATVHRVLVSVLLAYAGALLGAALRQPAVHRR